MSFIIMQSLNRVFQSANLNPVSIKVRLVLFLICKDTDERTNAHQNVQCPLRLFLRLLFRIWNFGFKTLTLDVLFLK